MARQDRGVVQDLDAERAVERQRRRDVHQSLRRAVRSLREWHVRRARRVRRVVLRVVRRAQPRARRFGSAVAVADVPRRRENREVRLHRVERLGRLQKAARVELRDEHREQRRLGRARDVREVERKRAAHRERREARGGAREFPDERVRRRADREGRARGGACRARRRRARSASGARIQHGEARVAQRRLEPVPIARKSIGTVRENARVRGILGSFRHRARRVDSNVGRREDGADVFHANQRFRRARRERPLPEHGRRLGERRVAIGRVPRRRERFPERAEPRGRKHRRAVEIARITRFRAVGGVRFAPPRKRAPGDVRGREPRGERPGQLRKKLGEPERASLRRRVELRVLQERRERFRVRDQARVHEAFAQTRHQRNHGFAREVQRPVPDRAHLAARGRRGHAQQIARGCEVEMRVRCRFVGRGTARVAPASRRRRRGGPEAGGAQPLVQRHARRGHGVHDAGQAIRRRRRRRRGGALAGRRARHEHVRRRALEQLDLDARRLGGWRRLRAQQTPEGRRGELLGRAAGAAGGELRSDLGGRVDHREVFGDETRGERARGGPAPGAAAAEPRALGEPGGEEVPVRRLGRRGRAEAPEQAGRALGERLVQRAHVQRRRGVAADGIVARGLRRGPVGDWVDASPLGVERGRRRQAERDGPRPQAVESGRRDRFRDGERSGVRHDFHARRDHARAQRAIPLAARERKRRVDDARVGRVGCVGARVARRVLEHARVDEFQNRRARRAALRREVRVDHVRRARQRRRHGIFVDPRCRPSRRARSRSANRHAERV